VNIVRLCTISRLFYTFDFGHDHNTTFFRTPDLHNTFYLSEIIKKNQILKQNVMRIFIRRVQRSSIRSQLYNTLRIAFFKPNISVLYKKSTKTNVREFDLFSASMSLDLVSFTGLRTGPSTASAMFKIQSASADYGISNRCPIWASIFLRIPK